MVSGKALIQSATIRSLGRLLDAVQASWMIAQACPWAVDTVARASPVFAGAVEKSMPITAASTIALLFLPRARGDAAPSPFCAGSEHATSA